MPLSLVWRGLCIKQHKSTPSSNDFFCVQGFPCFRKPRSVPGKFTNSLSTHGQWGFSLFLHVISFLEPLADEPWQIAAMWLLWFAAPPGVETRCVSKAQSLQFMAHCTACTSHSPMAPAVRSTCHQRASVKSGRKVALDTLNYHLSR